MHHDHFFYKRNLPHYQPPGGGYFVTFRLAHSLPKSVIAQIKMERKRLIHDLKHETGTNRKKALQIINKHYFKKFDQLLDAFQNGNFWLREDRIAAIVADKLHEFDGIRYTLICYCIMPNHVHVLFKLPSLAKRDKSRSTYPVTNIMRLIKGNTAYRINKVLGRTGQFWQYESYDHLVRDDKERSNIIRYILLNPVKAGLANNWETWKWSYCRKEYLLAM